MRAVWTAALVGLSIAVSAQDPPPKALIPFSDVRPLWDTLQPDLPEDLRGRALAELPSVWPAWVRAHDARIRARVGRGDEDSLVNVWLFGTSFTDSPPARPRDVERLGDGATLAQVADGRLQDLLHALASPGANDRLRWAAQFLRQQDIDPATVGGQVRVRELLADVGKRMLSENAGYAGALAQSSTGSDPLSWMLPYASVYRDRGLSSDTSILSSFAVDRALEALGTSRLVPAGSIRRVAVIGPGLDVINKADGYDFYPEQTIQPFALLDSLIRHGLSRDGRVTVATFDVSSRVHQHLAAARDRARAGTGYVLQLPLGASEQWSPNLIRYWEQAGDRIGVAVRASAPPRTAGEVRVRAVRIPPATVMAIAPRDLNIVVERLDPLAEAERFDLVVATNVLLYYDKFEQALALVNVARMLRSGGSLLSNQALRPVAPFLPAVGHDAVQYSTSQFDHLFWYQRQ